MTWEYEVIDLDLDRNREPTRTILNNVGSYGFELVTIVPARDPDGRRFYVAIFKRPTSPVVSRRVV